MSDKELMCHLRQMLKASQADREYLESYYDDLEGAGGFLSSGEWDYQ